MKDFSVFATLTDEKNAVLSVLYKRTNAKFDFHLNVEEHFGQGFLFDAITFDAESGHLQVKLSQEPSLVACPYCGFNMKAIQIRAKRDIIDIFQLSTENDDLNTQSFAGPYLVVDLCYMNNTYHCLSKSCGKFYKYADFLPRTQETQSKVHFSRRFLSFLNDTRAHMMEYMRVERLPQAEYNKQMVADFHFYFGIEVSQPQVYNLLRAFPQEDTDYLLEGNTHEEETEQ